MPLNILLLTFFQLLKNVKTVVLAHRLCINEWQAGSGPWAIVCYLCCGLGGGGVGW